MTKQPSEVAAADLIDLVLAVPGVTGMVPGIASTLRTLDSRIRRDSRADLASGLLIDPVAGTVTAEVGVDGSRPVRDIVRDVQLALRAQMGESDLEIRVRVQTIGG